MRAQRKAPTLVAAAAPSSNATPPVRAVVEPAGERRYLTVMFCDLVGSTSISAQLDRSALACQQQYSCGS
jgi:class 3 adenylate cyclase